VLRRESIRKSESATRGKTTKVFSRNLYCFHKEICAQRNQAVLLWYNSLPLREPVMMTLEDCRAFYAQEIRFAASLTTPGLVEAFARVPREKFLGPAPWLIGSATARALSLAGIGQMSYVSVEDPRDVYHNVVISLDRSKDINNGQPGSLALWIDALALKPGDRVFHLGCGVGYYTAIMAEVVGAGGSVVGVELDAGLAARAKENLAAYANVTVHAGDGAGFDPVCVTPSS